ncbi:hypothetical protein PAEPH01_2250 [Pancytospora epiphaga]|nr:hypothetical protein PAEPH01_2250 [Pancytospora epiphaga]
MSLLQNALSILVNFISVSEIAASCCVGPVQSTTGMCHTQNVSCLRNISGDAWTRNCILQKFTVTFGSTTAVDPATGVPAGFIDNSGNVGFFDSAESKEACQDDLYIKVDPTVLAAPAPAFDPSLQHVLIFTPKPDTTLDDITRLYSFYALRADPNPALQITYAINTVDYSLNIIFPAAYDYVKQTIVARYNTYATDTRVVNNSTAIPPVYTITINSEVLLSQVTGTVTPLPAPVTMQFSAESSKRPSQTTVLLADIGSKLTSACSGFMLDDCDFAKLRCHIRQIDVITKVSSSCARPKKCKMSKKCVLYKYFGFITSCLAVIPSKCRDLECDYAQKIVSACNKADDRYNVFCAIIARLCVSISVDAQIFADNLNAFFETIVGINMFCHPHRSFERLFGLSCGDAEYVLGVCAEEAAMDECGDEANKASEENEGNENEDGSKRSSQKGGIARHKWTIIIVVTVLVVGSVAAFMMY